MTGETNLFPAHVLLIHPEGNSFNNPTTKCIIDLLLEKNAKVTIRCNRTESRFPAGKGIKHLKNSHLLAHFKRFFINRVNSVFFTKLIIQLELLLIYECYDLIIGVDRQGLIEGSYLSRITGVPCFCFSFEILFEKETSPRYKAIEIEASTNISRWFIQDRIRAKLLQDENNINADKCFYLPVASAGPGTFKSSRLRDKLNIPTDLNVAIFMGSVVAWSMAAEILQSLPQWPDDWVLLIHDRYGNTANHLLKLGLTDELLSSSRLYVSDQPSISVDDMSEILSGISAGFAFYKATYHNIYEGENIRNIGLASGKISTFLRYGVPVIMNNIGEYAKFALKYKFGYVTSDPSNIAVLLNELDFNTCSSNARRFFHEKLDFNLYRDEVWKILRGDTTESESN